MLFYIKQLFLIAMLYAYIYSPAFQFLKYTPLDLLVPVAYAYLLINSLFTRLYRLFKKEMLTFLLLLGYTLLRGMLSEAEDLPFFYPQLLLVFEVFPVAFFLVHFASERDSDLEASNNRLINTVITVAMIAAAITFYLILNPSLSFIINNVVLRTNEFVETATHRCFGLSSSLTFSYAVAQGIVAAIVLHKISSAKMKYIPVFILFFLLLFISVIFNARTGLVPIVIMILYLLFIKRNARILYSVAFASLLLGLLFSSQYSEFFAENLSWSLQFFTETFDFVTNDKTADHNTFRVLFDDMFVVPDSISGWLFGTGKNIYLDAEQSSDVGYVLQLNFGGLVYIFILLSFVFSMFKRVNKYAHLKWFSYLFIFTVLICNIKGYFIYNDVAFRLLLLLYIGFVYNDSKNQLNNATSGSCRSQL